MAIKTRIMCAVLALAMLGVTAPAANAAGTGATFTLFLHDNGNMDETPRSKPAYDPSTMLFSWNGSRVFYRSGALAENVTLAAGDSVNVFLYRDATFESDFTTTVTVRYRLDGQATLLAQETFGPVHVEASRPTSEHPDHAGAVASVVTAYGIAADAATGATSGFMENVCQTFTPVCNTAAGRALDIAQRSVPGLGTFLGSFYDVVVKRYVDLALDAAVEEPAQGDLQDGWEHLTLGLGASTTVPAGATIEIEWQTTYPGHPVDQVKHPRFDPGELPRPDIVTYVDRADAPTRVEFTLG